MSRRSWFRSPADHPPPPPPIRWLCGAGIDGGRWAMAGDRFIGQVVHYDEPEGWAAFIHAERRGPVADGPWPTAGEAQAALEAAWAGRSAS